MPTFRGVSPDRYEAAFEEAGTAEQAASRGTASSGGTTTGTTSGGGVQTGTAGQRAESGVDYRVIPGMRESEVVVPAAYVDRVLGFVTRFYQFLPVPPLSTAEAAAQAAGIVRTLGEYTVTTQTLFSKFLAGGGRAAALSSRGLLTKSTAQGLSRFAGFYREKDFVGFCAWSPKVTSALTAYNIVPAQAWLLWTQVQQSGARPTAAQLRAAFALDAPPLPATPPASTEPLRPLPSFPGADEMIPDLGGGGGLPWWVLAGGAGLLALVFLRRR